MSAARALALVAVIGCAGACKRSTPPAESMPAESASVCPHQVGGDRPVCPRLPADYDPARAYPLVVLLHPFVGRGQVEPFKAAFGFRPLVEREKIILVEPTAVFSRGRYFWNATAACCAWAGEVGSAADDVAYLTGLVRELRAELSIDPRRIYAVGHSNGGFMSHRLACDQAGVFTAIASLAGTTHDDPKRCKPSRPVSVLHAHGTMDQLIRYTGGHFGPARADYPGALGTVRAWARLNGCSGELELQPNRRDLDLSVAGPEATAQVFEGCPKGGAVELWLLEGSAHSPDVSSGAFARESLRWLLAHPR